MAHATSKTGEHVPAWNAYTRRVGSSGDVGIWHETSSINDGSYVTIDHNMPPFGVGRVGTLTPATGHVQSANGRIGGAKSTAAT